MGTIINTTAIIQNNITSSLELTGQAGIRCLEKAGVNKNDIDLLINVGVYHDENIVEPAMAPLIQQRIGISPDPVNQETASTFCFDLYNGACGYVNALHVADATLKTGRAKHALIVSGDVHPSKIKHPAFPYSSVGAATLLSHSEDQDKGFRNFFINTSGDEYPGFEGGLLVTNCGPTGREKITLNQREDFVDHLYEFVTQSLDKYFNDHHIDTKSIRFLLSSQQAKGFAERVHTGIGLNNGSQPVDIYDEYGDPHTSALPLGFHKIVEAGTLKEHDNVLFVAAGSGLTSACALYAA
ncbi:MAG: 3-oxoacyl-[acyl-carrier-protein] synthase III C-terminal domain-containing protein [Myxococcota bacterium]|nr:3-oxoacyl-[acyl-carrier-protein] synthase III C-terminal domain-containing protein [Myxococcota bacterium]